MKKSNHLLKRSIFLAFSILMLVVFSFANFKSNTSVAHAADIQPQISGRTTIAGRSVFIHSPTYSVLYQRSIFFIDEYDNTLKVYNFDDSISDGKFSENYLELNELGMIVDVAYSSEYLFILSTNENNLLLTQIDLIDFQMNTPFVLEVNSLKYNKLSVFETTDIFLISLTSNSFVEENINPLILTINKTLNEITNYCDVQISETEILSTIYELIIVETTGTTSNDVYLSIIYDGNIGFFGTTFESLTDNSTITISSASRSYLGDLDDDDNAQNVSIKISSANTIKVNNETYFLITYTTSGNSTGENSKLYKYSIDVSGSSNNEFLKVLDLPASTISEFTMTSNSCIVSSSKDSQSIQCVELKYDTEQNQPTHNILAPIVNPTVDIVYKNIEEFEYVTANKPTVLLSTPWESESNSTCPINPTFETRDLIVIGYGRISGENITISDYKYCLYTFNGQNLKGYVKTEDLTAKEVISVANYEYKKFKVQPNTNLYSLPTTVINDRFTPTLSSQIIATISENSIVEVVDVICRYKSDEKIMLKVKVNNNESLVGYIEYDKIIKPSNPIDFVITNASIKSNNTKIYESADSSSAIICTLDKGYRIRINGSRDTKSGYTSVTFNDEYGNEITGYILTDSLGSDSWTTMQIIGCVLIAINIGLLILILRFKHNSIGNGGAKYIDNENKQPKTKIVKK